MHKEEQRLDSVLESLEKSLSTFNKNPTAGTAKELISQAWKERKDLNLVFQIYQTLIDAHKIPNTSIYSKLLYVCQQTGSFKRTLSLWSDMVRYSIPIPDHCTRTLLTAASNSKDGNVSIAKQIFEKLRIG